MAMMKEEIKMMMIANPLPRLNLSKDGACPKEILKFFTK